MIADHGVYECKFKYRVLHPEVARQLPYDFLCEARGMIPEQAFANAEQFLFFADGNGNKIFVVSDLVGMALDENTP